MNSNERELQSGIFNEKFLGWAREAFRYEISVDFRRAATFDGFLSQIRLKALKGLSEKTLGRLASVMPMGAAFASSTAKVAFQSLPREEKVAIANFKAQFDALWKENFDLIGSFLHQRRERKDEADCIRKAACNAVKRIAASWQCTAVAIEPAVWRVSRETPWGEIMVHWNFEQAFELECRLFVYDDAGRAIRTHDDYLGTLGIGPSLWALTNLESVENKVLEASKFVSWHISEYSKIMEST
jgi:hypothetical protein